MSWYAAYTKPRSEKKCAERLVQRGWGVYCPLKKEVKQWSDRKKKVETPYFPSYIFVQLESYEAQRELVLRDPGVLNFVFWQGKPAIISDKEMNEVIDFFEKYETQRITASTIKIGSEVELGEGPFKGRKGIVTKLTGGKVTMIVHQLGFQLTVNLES